MNKTINLLGKHGASGAKRSMTLAGVGLLSLICAAGIPTASSASPNRNPENKTASASPRFKLPFANGRVTSHFHQGRWHPGIDLAAPMGTPIAATTSGQKVTFAGRRGGYGNAVITRDSSGRTHLYGHLQRITVRSGQTLNQGQKLGTVGSTGYSTGPHLHFEVRINDRAVNPRPFLEAAPHVLEEARGTTAANRR